MNGSQFRIEKKINESATTIVYRAFDEVLHRTVLLKVLHKHLANDEALKGRFVREARACAALRSEHIVQVYDLTEIEDAPAIVMEFVEGQSLKEVLAGSPSDRLNLTKKTGVHVLRALALAHERGIIHRDIKPGNILVSEDGTIKVTDFGLAYVALSPTVTMEGMVLGTPAYMAPEQIRGDDIDARTDLFALGVTLIEVLSGERIFEGSTYTECMRKVLAFTLDDMDRFDHLSSPEMSLFLKKLLEPEKRNRFPSAREALNVIDEKKSSVFVKPISLDKQRNLLPMGMMAFAVLALAIFGWVNLSEKNIYENSSGTMQPNEVDSDSLIARSEPIPQQSTESPIQTTTIPVDKIDEEKEISHSITPIDSGRIFLTSTPWAKVYVNNLLIGETPIAKPIVLAVGSHTVMFTNPSFDPIVRTITVESNRDMNVEGNFIETAGYLQCVVSPWAEVYIDEQYKDTTPLTKPIMMSAGKHTVRFRNSAFPDIITEVIIIAKDTSRIAKTFIQ